MKLSWRVGIAVLATVAVLALVAVACGEEEEAPEGAAEARTPVATPTLAATPELEEQQVVESINVLLSQQAEVLMSGDWESSYAFFADECREMASLEEHTATFEPIRANVLRAGITSLESSVLEVTSIRGNRALVVIEIVAKSDGEVLEQYSGSQPDNEYVLEGGTWKDANCESIR